ncbi:hypothetical protein HK104_011335 [Borealophlyctis nickersoniae]|nr:hypothetical protein HK104_011335 [Borealophlyctis nickersoniae]
MSHVWKVHETVRNRYMAEKSQYSVLLGGSQYGSPRKSEANGDMAESPVSGFLSPPVSKFQPAIKPLVTAVVKERIEDGLVIKDAQQTLEEWKIEQYIDAWVENMRQWVAAKVVRPVADRIEQVDQQFAAAGIPHLDCRAAADDATFVAMAGGQSNTFMGGSGSMIGTSTPGARKGRHTSASQFAQQQVQAAQAAQAAEAARRAVATASVGELFKAYPNEPVVVERKKLEMYLSIPNYRCRAYIVERVKGMISLGGITAEDKRAYQELQLLAKETSLEITSGTQVNLGREGNGITNFFRQTHSSKYFIPLGAKPEPAGGSVQIRHYTKTPPHFYVVIEGTVFDVLGGRNNLFYALCLFAHYIKVSASGYVGVLNIGGRSVDLLDQIPGGPVSGIWETAKREQVSPQKDRGRASTGGSPLPYDSPYAPKTPTPVGANPLQHDFMRPAFGSPSYGNSFGQSFTSGSGSPLSAGDRSFGRN